MLLAVGVCAWIATEAFTTRIVTNSQTSDYWEHAATLRALLDDPWHPRNPQLVSPASAPRFIPTFILCALLGRALDYDALGAMSLSACLNLLLLMGGIFCFFRSYFRDARAPLYGLIIMLASWWDGFHYSNVYQLKILFSTVSYPSTAALGLSLLTFTVVLRTLRSGASWGGLALVSGCCALVVITHPLTAVLGIAGAFLLTLDERDATLEQRVKTAAAVTLGCLLALAWPYFSLKGVLLVGGHNEIASATQAAASKAPEPSGLSHPFYQTTPLLLTLGLALGGLPLTLYLLVRRRWFIALGALSMLLPFVVNAYRPLPLGHRFILLAIFYLQLALVWLLLKLTRGAPEASPALTSGRRAWLSGAFVAATLLGSAIWNLQAAEQHVAAQRKRLRDGESLNIRYARRAAELAGRDAVILADIRSSWPLPAFGPRILALLHPNPLVLDADEREAAVTQFVRGSGGDRHRSELLKRYGVTHVLTNRATRRRLHAFLAPRSEPQSLPGGYSLYRLKRLD